MEELSHVTLSRLGPRVVNTRVRRNFTNSCTHRPSVVIIAHPINRGRPLPFNVTLVCSTGNTIILVRNSNIATSEFTNITNHRVHSTLSCASRGANTCAANSTNDIFRHNDVGILYRGNAPGHNNTICIHVVGGASLPGTIINNFRTRTSDADTGAMGLANYR